MHKKQLKVPEDNREIKNFCNQGVSGILHWGKLHKLSDV